MQFGRLHGFALIVLGGLLLLAQTFVIFAGSTKTERPKPEETSQTASKPPTSFTRGFNYLPGVLGVAMVGLGGYALVLRQRKIIKEADEAEENARHSAPNYGR